MNLKLSDFILENPDWKDLLQSDPYHIDINENDDYMLLKYNMIESNFDEPVVKECRGLIIRKKDYKPVCVPFFKFFNVQETNAANIDWESARVQEKIDGSMIKVWFDNGDWHYSTSSTIDAKEVRLGVDIAEAKTFYDLFWEAENFPSFFLERLNPENTYMFELVSPLNRIVVPYIQTAIWHTGTRNNKTLEELNEEVGIRKPKEFPLHTLKDCLEAVESLPFSEEGYVVVDKYWNRVKIKSPAYVAAHHIKNNGVITYSRIVDMIKIDGQDDFVSIYPEYSEPFFKVEKGMYDLLDNIERDWIEFHNVGMNEGKERKEVALWINQTRCPPALFSLYDKKVSGVREWLWKQQNDKILTLIGIKE